MSRGQVTRARYALEQAVRYRSDGAGRTLVGIAPGVGGAAMARAQCLARAWLERDAVGLEASAHDLAGRGLLWRALEIAALGSSLSADGESPLLASLRARCPFLISPVVPAARSARLTAREREVAERASRGATDAQIAEDLRISIRTVQTHLTNVYRKLGAGGRSQLGGLLSPTPRST